jgi:hypothetical protein
MKLNRLASALSFAHLLGLPSASAAKAEDDKEKDDELELDDKDPQGADESDEDYAKRMEEKDDDKKSEKDTGEDDDERQDAKGKRAAEDDDGEMAARSKERTRCAKIVAFGIKNNCIRQAGVFAFDTNLTASQAIAAITAGGVDGRKAGSLAGRMADTRIPNVGADGGAGVADMSNPAAAAKATAELIIRAGQKRRNEV